MALPALLCTGGIPPFASRKDLVNGIPGAGRDGTWEDLEGVRMGCANLATFLGGRISMKPMTIC